MCKCFFTYIFIYIHIVYNFHTFIFIYIYKQHVAPQLWRHTLPGEAAKEVFATRLRDLLRRFPMHWDFFFWQSWLVGHVCIWYVADACRCVKTSTARIFCWYQFCCERIGLLHKWLKFAYKSVEWYEAKQSQSLVPNFSVVISKLIFLFFFLNW